MTPAVVRAFDFGNHDAVRYVEYWGDIAPRTSEEVFKRFLFAFCSVHTTWECNVAGYQAIKDLSWIGNERALREKLRASGAGLHNHRAKWISAFADAYWDHPRLWTRRAREPWAVYRDRLVAGITGLGKAKVSFALEMAYPLEAEVLCLDVHMLRMYGVKDQSKVRVGEYERYEYDWLGRARAAEMPSYIVKQIHWDALQGRPDSRYWSHVLEN